MNGFLSVFAFVFAVSSAHAVSRLPEGHPHEEIAIAITNRAHLYYVEALNVQVVKLLPDDDDGRPHQNWVFRLANGLEVRAIYNIDMGERVPLRVGDVISVGGELRWSKRGAIIHWLHADPNERRPDGYVLHRGERYGELEEFKALPSHKRDEILQRKRERERRLRDPRYARKLERLGFGSDAAAGALRHY